MLIRIELPRDRDYCGRMTVLDGERVAFGPIWCAGRAHDAVAVRYGNAERSYFLPGTARFLWSITIAAVSFDATSQPNSAIPRFSPYWAPSAANTAGCTSKSSRKSTASPRSPNPRSSQKILAR